jgi:hypothetical protein
VAGPVKRGEGRRNATKSGPDLGSERRFDDKVYAFYSRLISLYPEVETLLEGLNMNRVSRFLLLSFSP